MSTPGIMALVRMGMSDPTKPVKVEVETIKLDPTRDSRPITIQPCITQEGELDPTSYFWGEVPLVDQDRNRVEPPNDGEVLTAEDGRWFMVEGEAEANLPPAYPGHRFYLREVTVD